MNIIFNKADIFSAILSVIVLWLKRTVKVRLNVDLPDDIIWKLYYEIKRYVEKTQVGKLLQDIDKEQFLNFMKEFIDVIDEEHPAFLDNHELMWDLFVLIKDYVNSDWLKQNAFTESLAEAVNRKIISTPELLEYKVKRDVDEAIKEYEKTETVVDTVPVIEIKENVSNPFGFDEIRIHARWINNEN